MSKHLCTVFCALSLAVVLFAGCQKAIEPAKTPLAPVSSSVSESEVQPSVVSEMITDPGIETTGATDSFVSLFEAALKNSNLELKDKTVKDAASLGALEGYGFNVNARPLEVYLFDPSSSDPKAAENLKTANESGFITIFGVEINGKPIKPACVLNGNFVIIFPMEDIIGAHPNKETVVQAFLSIAQ